MCTGQLLEGLTINEIVLIMDKINKTNVPKESSHIYKSLSSRFIGIFILGGLMMGCVTQKKYDAALREVARLTVDSTFQEYAAADVAYKKEGVIFKQNRELILKSDKLDSLIRLVELHKEGLKKAQDIMNGLQGKGWQVDEIEGKLLISLDHEILFESGSNQISSEGKSLVKGISSSIIDLDTEVDIWVIGYTDDQTFSGEKKDNWDLSSERALAVVREMINNDILPSTITAGAKSKYDPEASNRKSNGRSLNRRTDVLIVPKNTLNKALAELLDTE
ncbi:MAG: flagellar motor protein MotB [Cyclobacteriaceae bacterium]|jgi:flagellar motor protein MotB